MSTHVLRTNLCWWFSSNSFHLDAILWLFRFLSGYGCIWRWLWSTIMLKCTSEGKKLGKSSYVVRKMALSCRERDEWTREKWRFNKFWFFFRLLSGELWECVCTFFCPGSHIFHSSKHHHHRCTYLFPFVCLQRLYTNSSMFLTPNLFVDLVYVCTLLQRVYCVCVYVSSSWHSKNLLCAAFAWLFVVNTLCSFDKSSIASLQHFRCHIVQHNRIAKPGTTTICEQSHDLQANKSNTTDKKNNDRYMHRTHTHTWKNEPTHTQFPCSYAKTMDLE